MTGRTVVPVAIAVGILLVAALLAAAQSWIAAAETVTRNKQLELLRQEDGQKHAAEQALASKTQTQLADRADAALADLRAREAELHEARAQVARLTAEAEADRRSRAGLEKEIAALHDRLETASRPVAPATKAPEPAAPAAPPKAAEAPKEPPPLGPSAVTDAGQVRKVLDGLNAILALAEEKEAWSVASADAVDGDRLVKAVVEAKARGEGLSRTFRAAEVRFVLQSASGTLEVRLRDGTVTYPGDRTVPFPEGRYSAVLTVDAGAVRNAGNPLVSVR